MNRTASEMTDNTTAIPEELKRSVPRPWKLTAQGKGVFAGAILMVIAAVAFTVGAYVSVRHTAAIHRAMMQQAHQRIILADHRKIGAVGRSLIWPADDLDKLITDKSTNDDAIAPFTARGIVVLRA